MTDFSPQKSKLDFVAEWTALTALSTVVGGGLGLLVAQVFFCNPSIYIEVSGSIVMGTLIGAAVGYVQYLKLKGILSKPTRWIWANVLGWAAAVLICELNFPFSRCFASSNAPHYNPGIIIENFQDLLLMPSEYAYTLTNNIQVYQIADTINIFLILALCLAIPLGLSQWWVLRKDFTHAGHILWVTVLSGFVGSLGNYYLVEEIRSNILALIWVGIIPPLATSITLVLLKRNTS